MFAYRTDLFVHSIILQPIRGALHHSLLFDTPKLLFLLSCPIDRTVCYILTHWDGGVGVGRTQDSFFSITKKAFRSLSRDFTRGILQIATKTLRKLLSSLVRKDSVFQDNSIVFFLHLSKPDRISLSSFHR